MIINTSENAIYFQSNILFIHTANYPLRLNKLLHIEIWVYFSPQFIFPKDRKPIRLMQLRSSSQLMYLYLCIKGYATALCQGTRILHLRMSI